MSDLTYWYWLKEIKGIGPARCNGLLEVFGSPEEIFRSGLEDYLKVNTIGKKLASAIDSSKEGLDRIKAMLEREVVIIDRLQLQVITVQDPLYPATLKEQPVVAPPVLYVRGDLSGLTPNTLAIVGTRHPSPTGREKATRLARQGASKGWSIISGLALGIDAEAHKGALAAGGYTVAVLGCGVDRVYPPENRGIYEEIAKKGAIISEYRLGTMPRPGNLRKRNKMIVGLSRGVVIAECPEDSGSLIAAKEAEKQGKPLLAFRPADPFAKSSQGSAKLISEGKAEEMVGVDIDWVRQRIEVYRPPT